VELIEKCRQLTGRTYLDFLGAESFRDIHWPLGVDKARSINEQFDKGKNARLGFWKNLDVVIGQTPTLQHQYSRRL
jgi:hypothetical protein